MLVLSNPMLDPGNPVLDFVLIPKPWDWSFEFVLRTLMSGDCKAGLPFAARRDCARRGSPG